MKTAQRLFEGLDIGGETIGLITYMRTDSVQLSSEALDLTRKAIGARYGERYLPEAPRRFKTKTKNAQEAHEAIRPTDPARAPQEVGRYLDDDQRRLYELIWKRTVASQMTAALMDRVTIDVIDANDRLSLRASGQTVAFDGFLALYQEGRDDPAEDEDGEARLPPLTSGQRLDAEEVTPSQHFTEPPPRYSEASLVKQMEELGIGRPSTYASIITVLQDRSYVRLRTAASSPRAAAPGDGVPHLTFRHVCPADFHGGPGGQARLGRGRRDGLEGRAARLLGGLQGPARRGRPAARC